MNERQLSSVQLTIRGMHCAGCASRLEAAFSSLEGVSKAVVNFATGTARVDRSNDKPSSEMLVATAVKAGFEATLAVSASGEALGTAQIDEFRATYHKWLFAAAGFVPLSILSMSAHAGLWNGFGHFAYGWIFEAIVSGAVVFGAGCGILKSAMKSIRRLNADMDTLIGGGAFMAWSGSFLEMALRSGGHHESYFEASAGIIAFALLGRWLEARARTSAGEAIQSLASLRPEIAQVELDGKIIGLPVVEITPGMTVVLAPGERIPVDGEVIEGESFIDEGWVTGESVPVIRGLGDPVIGGTINGASALKVKVTAAGRSAFLDQVVAIVREAQTSKPPIQRAADAIAKHFSGGVLGAALLTTLLWWIFGAGENAGSMAFWHGLSVLVVACPCALGLATPVAVLVGSGSAARRGILFRSGAALELLSTVRLAVFDKTGTLTVGQMQVVEWWEREIFDQQVLGWVAVAEQQSVHPVAKALLRAVKERGLTLPTDVHSVEAIPGRGLKAQVEGRTLLVGQLEWMQAEGVVFPKDVSAFDGERNFVAVDGEFAAWFRVADRLREEAAEVVRKLQTMGIRSVLLSGDHAVVAGAIAAAAGISEVRAGVRPDGKRDAILEYQKAGEIVLMVGDGINDAPALAQADVGIAMGGGTSVARQTADVTLMRDDLKSLVEAIDLSRRTLAVIRQNLAFAFGYNLIALPLAAGVTERWGWSPGPIVASAAMALSSVSVVINALRLRVPSAGRGR